MTRFFFGVPLLVVLIVISRIPGGEGKDVYVNQTATGDSPDGSEVNPFKDMSSALQEASAGDRVFVASGKYEGSENRDLTLNFPLEIRAIDFDNRPEFNLESKGTFATFDPEQTKPNSASSSAIIGFVFENGVGTKDSGAVLTIKSGSLTVADCEFKNNVGDEGGSVVVTSSDSPSSMPNLVTFEGCKWKENKGSKGAAVRIYPRQSRSVVIGGCHFENNNASSTGGAVYSQDSSLVVVYSNFTSNMATGSFGGAIATESSQQNMQVKVYSSWFISNSGGEQGGGIYFDGGVLMLSKSLFQENSLQDTQSLRQGAALYVYGSAIIEGCNFFSNDAGDTGSTYGGGIVLNGDKTSWVSDSSFKENVGFYGTDVAVLSGTTAYFTEVTFEATVQQQKYQIYSTGQVLFENCDFQQENGKQSLLSAYAAGIGTIDFEWFPEAVDFSIELVTLLHDGALKTSSNLNISVCSMHGGLILSTSTSTRRSLSILVSMTVAPTDGDAILGISGFDVVNYGLFSLSAGYTFSADEGRGTFTNEGEVVLQKGSIITGMDMFVNNHQVDIKTRAAINSKFSNNNGATITLNDVVSSSSAALVIAGTASLDGDLIVNLNSTSSEFEKGNSRIALLSYTSLEGLFSDYKVSPSVKKSSLVYNPFVLYLSNQNGSSDSGLSGGEIALTVIGALVGAVILGVAVWYFWIRNPAEDSFSVLGGASDVEI